MRFNGKELLFIANARPWSSELVVLEDKSVWSSFLQSNILATLLVRNGTVWPHEPRKYEFHLKPGSSVEDVRLAYRGAEGLKVGAGGSSWCRHR